jgi:hypothetical protein
MKLKLKALGGLLGGLLLAMVAPVASAYDVDYTAGNEVLCATGTDPSQTAFEASVAACASPGTVTELYKAEVSGGESGPFAGSYSTTFANTPTDPADATITYTGGTAISCSGAGSKSCFLGVKDGNANPTYYVFDISDWDGTSSIVMTGFWPDQGAISNVSIWGTDGKKVPEPASLALVGLGLLAVGVARRRRSA